MAGEWATKKVGNVAMINSDTFSTIEERWGFINYLDTGNITEGKIENIQRISDIKLLPSRARRKVQAGDIVYSTVRPNQKHYGFITAPLENMLVSTGFAVLRGIEGKCDTKFLYYFLTQKPVVVHLQTIAEHSTSTYPSIRPSDIESLDIELPPPPEQRAIAHILGTLDDKIELNRRMNETLEGMARAIFKSWFVDFDPVHAKCNAAHNRLVGAGLALPNYEGAASGAPTGKNNIPKPIADLFPDSFQDSELGRIPNGWGVGRLAEEFNLTMGQSPPGETYNEIGDGMPFFQGRTDFGFRYPSKRIFCTAPTRFANQGDTLVSVRAPVGDINMALEKCCIGRGVASIRHKSASRSYTYYAMHSLVDAFRNFEAGGTVFGCINKNDFQRLKFIVPPTQLVLAYEKMTFPLDHTIENQLLQSSTLTTIRDALLPKLLSGEIRIPEATIQMEKEL